MRLRMGVTKRRTAAIQRERRVAETVYLSNAIVTFVCVFSLVRNSYCEVWVDFITYHAGKEREFGYDNPL